MNYEKVTPPEGEKIRYKEGELVVPENQSFPISRERCRQRRCAGSYKSP